jgi:hypothetical protein
MDPEKGTAPQPRRRFPKTDTDQASGHKVSYTNPEATDAGPAGPPREPGDADDRHESINESFQLSQAALEASQRVRQRGAAAGRRAEELRQWVASTIADVAVIEERIAQIHEGMAARSPGSAPRHQRFAADARAAVSRAREIRALIVPGDQYTNR